VINYIYLLVSDIMTQDKKSKKNDIDKLRMILDSPSDPKVKKLVDKHEKHLESIRNRLSEEPFETQKSYSTSDFIKKSDSLEPHVVIHRKEEETHFTPIESESYHKEHDGEYDEDLKDLIDVEGFFEVEKVVFVEPEFLEVTPKEKEKTMDDDEKREELHFIPISEDNTDTIKQKDIKGFDRKEEMPEWKLVDDIATGKGDNQEEEQRSQQFDEVSTIEKKPDQKQYQDIEEEIPLWEPIDTEQPKNEREEPIEFVEKKPTTITFEEVSDKKTVTSDEIKLFDIAKKTKRKKMNKEEKKLKKLEQKKAKKEAKALKKKKRNGKKGETTSTIPTSELKEIKTEKQKTVVKKDQILSATERKELKKPDKKQKVEKKGKPDMVSSEWDTYDIDEAPDVQSPPSAYKHGDFTLYKKDIKTATGKIRPIHFFSKKPPEAGEAVQLPDGYTVKVHKRTGLPYLKKTK
jgi:hypothetical protein